MKILLFFVTVVCAVQANIVIQVIQEVKGGYGGSNGGGGGGGGDETTEGELDLDALENELNALNEELNNLQNQANAAVAAGDAIAEANSAIQAFLDALNGGRRKRRRHRRSVVDLVECDAAVSLDGDSDDVIVVILDAIATELAGLADSLDSTKLDCYIERLEEIGDAIADGSVVAPADLSAITASATAASNAATAAKTAVGEVADNIAASITAAEDQIAATQDAINEAGGSDTVETTTVETSATDAVSDCDYTEFADNHTMLSEAKCDITSSGVTDEEKSTILSKHNLHRLWVAIGEEENGNPGPQSPAENMLEIVWNEELAKVAEAWAKQCPLLHDCDDCRKICSRDYDVGQNMFVSLGEDPTTIWEEAIDSWYGEVKDMRKTDVPEFQGNYSPDVDIGHYTQIVWAETYEVGCGRVHYSTTVDEVEFPESKIYVCNYGPSGNILGKPVYTELTPTSKCINNSETYDGLCAK